MNLSRKEFFRQGFFSLGDTLLKATGLEASTTETMSPDEALPYNGLPRVAVARNENCLARHCGCFSCVEHCEVQAINVVMGEGIRIDKTVCTGCGNCLDICPVTPKAIYLATVGHSVADLKNN